MSGKRIVATAVLAAALVATGVVAQPVAATDAVDVLSQPVQIAHVDGADLGYRVAGDGRPLVLISGSSNTMAEWDPRFVNELAKTRRVVVFDNRGVGTSTGDVRDLTIALMARDTRTLIDQVAGGRADVLGWSMGGYIAQELAIRNPKHVRRLVLASTNCGGPRTAGPTPAALRVLLNPDATPEQRMSILFPADRMDDAAAWSTAIGEAYGRAGYQPANAFDVPEATARAQTRAAGPLWLGKGRGTCARLGRITHPTLISAGRDDVVVPASNRTALADGIRRSTGKTYADAGHAFLFQPGLTYAAAVTAFLDQ